MSFDPLLTVLGLTALATATVPTTYAPTATRAAIRITEAALPASPGTGDLAIDSGDSNKLKWWNGSAWQTAGGGGTPAGADTQIQYNNAGAFGATADLYLSSTYGLYTQKLLVSAPGKSAFYVSNTLASAGATLGSYTASQVYINRTVANGETAAVSMRGLYVEAKHLGANASTAGSSVIGAYFNAENGATAGTISSVAGAYSSAQTAAGGITTTVTGHSAFITLGGASTTAYGLSISASGAGAITTLYGIYVDVNSPTNVTNRWGIYQLGATAGNYLAGYLGVAITPSSSTALCLPAGTTAVSSLRITQGAAPSSPVNGDMWLTTAAAYMRRNGGTISLVQRVGATVSGTVPGWSDTAGSLGDSTLSFATASGLTYYSFACGTTVTNFSQIPVNVTATYTAAASGTTGGIRSTLTYSTTGAGATAIASGFHALININANSVVDTQGAQYVGTYNQLTSTPPSFGWATNSTFKGTYDKLTLSSTTNDSNRPFYRMIGSEVDLSFTLTGTSGTAGAIDGMYGYFFNPGTLSNASGRTASVTNFYGIYLGAVTIGGTGAGTLSITNRYGVYQADTAANNYFAGNVQIADKDLILGTTTGTKIGTATTQKLAFYNSTPIVQQSSTGETAGFTAGAGTNVTDQSTFTGNVGATAYRISDIVKHLKNLGLIAA